MIKVNFKGILLGVEKREYTRKSDGKQSMVYNLSVKQGGSVATVSCEKSLSDAYDSGIIQDFKEYNFGCQYDDRYQNFRIIDALPSGK